VIWLDRVHSNVAWKDAHVHRSEVGRRGYDDHADGYGFSVWLMRAERSFE